MATNLEAKREHWDYLKNALTKGVGDKRFRQLCEWFFGETPTIRACAEIAYPDARRNLVGIGTQNEKGVYKAFIDDVCGTIEAAYHRLKTVEKTVQEYNIWHKSACESIIKCAEKIKLNKKFTHGHAQKWLNMTLKNMLVAETADWHRDLAQIRVLLHAPVDRNVIRAADFQLGIRKKDKATGKLNRYTTDKYIAWGNWDFEIYSEFQQALRLAISTRQDYDCPIAWEFDAWIASKASP